MQINKVIVPFFTLFLFLNCKTKNNTDVLKNRIENSIGTHDIGCVVLNSKNGEVTKINGDRMFPMLSTFKFPIALTVLNKVEKGDLTLDQPLFIKKEQFIENTWSPFRKKFPNGNTIITLEEALNWMIVYSDNNLTDVLLELVGGPTVVTHFINNKNIQIKINEAAMHVDWESQFINKATPKAMSKLLKEFYEGKIVNQKHTQWLYNAMLKSNTGLNRLKGKLPDVKIAQRAGTSFTNDNGITGAINNIGIIELPNNEKIYISVFIKNTPLEFAKAEEIIADIAQTTYTYFLEKNEFN